MSKYSCFDVSIENGVAYVTMNRPDKLNTMVKVFWKELPEIVNDIDRNAEARVLVLQAEGKHFSAGMDFGNFSDDGQSKDKEPARLREFFYNEILELQDTFSSLEDCRMPTIAAIQGACIGGAIDMVSACDMRYCDENAFFKIAEVDIGIAPDVGTLQRLPSLMPIAAVRELAYTGRKFDASEAKNLGLINEVYSSKEDMLKQVKLKAEEIAKKSPVFKDFKNDKYKIISFYAKKARGLMARWIIENKITDSKDLKKFNVDGYYYSAKDSTESEPVFLRD